jgi:hypothetical protein
VPDNHPLDFPLAPTSATRAQWLAALADEAQRPAHGTLPGTLIVAAVVREFEKYRTARLPWATFSTEAVLDAAEDYAAWRQNLFAFFGGVEGDHLLGRFEIAGLHAAQASVRHWTRSSLAIVLVPNLTAADKMLRLEIRGRWAYGEITRRLRDHVGRHALTAVLANRLADASTSDVVRALVDGVSQEQALTLLERAGPGAWKGVPQGLQARILDQAKPHGGREARRHLQATEAWTTLRRYADMPTSDLIRLAVTGGLNFVPTAIRNGMIDYGRHLVGPARDVFAREATIVFENDPEAPDLARRPDPMRPYAAIADHADLDAFLARRPEHRAGATWAIHQAHGEAIGAIAARAGVTRKTVRRHIQRFHRALREISGQP